jgi:hypothetical protein
MSDDPDDLGIVVSHPEPKFEANVAKDGKTGLYGWSLTRYDYTPSESVRPRLIYTSGDKQDASGNTIWAIFKTYGEAYEACRKVSENYLKHFEWNPTDPKHITWPPEAEPVGKKKALR